MKLTLYLMAGRAFPNSATYEDFPQHENGIGMVRALYDEIERLERGTRGESPVITGEWRSIPAAPAEGYRAPRHTGTDPDPDLGPVVLVTGRYGRRVLEPVTERLAGLAERDIRLLEVENDFFGGNVSVSGLLVGADIKRALAEDSEGAGVYLIPDLAVVGDVFLDGVELADVAESARAPLVTVEATAAGILAGAPG